MRLCDHDKSEQGWWSEDCSTLPGVINTGYWLDKCHLDLELASSWLYTSPSLTHHHWQQKTVFNHQPYVSMFEISENLKSSSSSWAVACVDAQQSQWWGVKSRCTICNIWSDKLTLRWDDAALNEQKHHTTTLPPLTQIKQISQDGDDEIARKEDTPNIFRMIRCWQPDNIALKRGY